MLEAFVLWRLCKSNIANDRARGRSGSGVPVYTILIWIIGELLGFFIGSAACRAFGWPIKLALLWIFAFLFTFLLSQVSRLIARR